MILIPESIIKEAIEKGGYEQVKDQIRGGALYGAPTDRIILLDPLFWQALGKARQWHGRWHYKLGNNKRRTIEDWEATYLTFCELLATSPTQEQVDEFWKNLL